MLYMLSLIDEEPNWEEVKPEEMQAMVDEMGKYNDELKEAGRRRSPTGPSPRPRSS